jgi:hypothetical protein
MSDSKNNHPTHESTPAVKLAIAWLWVGIPLAWGVAQTMTKALGLFR